MIRRHYNRNQAGFTLIELVVVIVVLLAALILPNLAAVRERARRVECLQNMNQCWKAISVWGLSPEDSYREEIAGTNSTDAICVI